MTERGRKKNNKVCYQVNRCSAVLDEESWELIMW